MTVQHTDHRAEGSVGHLTDPHELRDRLRSDLVVASKTRQVDTMAALRTTLAAIDNAEAVDLANHLETSGASPIAGARAGVGSTEVARRVLTFDDIRTILSAQVAERCTAADDYDTYGKHAAASKLRREADALVSYLTDAQQQRPGDG